ncbi:MAG: hypothetical protein ACI83O_000667 [Patescibacteria group bacterium]|jgi:hypothetical protein
MKAKTNSILFVSTLFVTLVSAQSFGGGLAQGSQNISNLIISVFSPLFGIVLGGQPEQLFEGTLLFLIILSVVYMIINNMALFKDNKKIVAIITFSVSILAARFMLDSKIINTILLPYGVLGVSLTAFLPLLIAFFFVYAKTDTGLMIESSFMRKIFWVFFTVVFFSMWNIRYDDLGGSSWIYFWSAALSLLLFLFDGSIRRAMIRGEIEQLKHASIGDYMGDINERMAKLEESHNKNFITDSHYKREMKKLEQKLKQLRKG